MIRLFAALLLIAPIVGCAAGAQISSPRSGATTNGGVPADQRMPSLPQRSSVHMGGAVPPQFAVGTFRRGQMPMRYPDNSGLPRSAFLTPAQVKRRAHIGKGGVIMRVSNIMSFSQVNSDGATIAAISPSRQVYEVTENYTGPFSSLGNQYSSGQQTLVIDAQTGQTLESISSGTLTRSGAPPAPTPTRSYTPKPCLRQPCPQSGTGSN